MTRTLVLAIPSIAESQSRGEADVLEHLELERPSHRVKSLRQIDFEQNRGVVFGMESTTGELYGAVLQAVSHR